MKRFLLATLLCAIGHCAYGADTDGDGLLDVIDVPGLTPMLVDSFTLMIVASKTLMMPIS